MFLVNTIRQTGGESINQYVRLAKRLFRQVSFSKVMRIIDMGTTELDLQH